MQNIISNFISGIILLFERPIRLGDRVVIDGILGEVIEIKLRATVIRTLDHEHIIIPNSYFLEQRVLNRSYGDLKTRLVIEVGVSYASDVKLVEKLLLDAAKTVELKIGKIIKEPKPVVHFIKFGESSLDFKLYVWVDNPASSYIVKSELHFEIFSLFKENNVQIPFPQRDIHMKNEE